MLFDVIDFVETFWRSAPEPGWETRWRALDPAESAWLAEMSRSRDWLRTLTDPEEIDLATGFYRHERRYRVYVDLAALPFMVAAGCLALAGLVPVAMLGLAASAFTLVRAAVFYLRERQIKKTYQQAKDNYLALTASGPAPATSDPPETAFG